MEIKIIIIALALAEKMHTLSSSSSAHSRNRGDRQAGWDMHANSSFVNYAKGKLPGEGRRTHMEGKWTATINSHALLRRIINFMAWRTGPTTAACFQDVTKNLRDLFGSFNSPPAADDRQLSDYFHFLFFRKNRNEMRFFFSGLSSTCVHEGWAKRVKKIFNMWWWTWLVPRRKHTTTLHGSIFFLFSLLLIDRVRQPSLIGRQWKHFSAFLFSSSWVCPRKIKTVSISEKLTRARAHLN